SVDPCCNRPVRGRGQHVFVGVEAGNLVEEVSQRDAKRARAASDIEKAACAVKAAFGCERGGQGPRVCGPTARIVDSATAIDRWVIGHGRSFCGKYPTAAP